MKKALIAAGLSLTLIVAGAAGSAHAAKGGNGQDKSPDKWMVSVADDEITVGETATVTATITRDKQGANKGTAMLALGDGCTGGTIAPSASQDFTFKSKPKTNEVTVTWTVSGLAVGKCEVTVATGEKNKTYAALGEGVITVNAEDDDGPVTGSASWLLSGLALGLLGLGTGSLMLSRRRMI
ncbi:MAG: hypothetical protein ACKOA2_10425 [Ilumatobacteraceae bacterium]